MFASARAVMTLDPRSFYPPPKVRSAVVVLDPIEPPYSSDRDTLLDLISHSFRMRRKKLVNNLTGWRNATREILEQAMVAAEIDTGVRAETLALADFDRLLQHVTQLTPRSPNGV